MSDFTKGQFLVSNPVMGDPNFDHSVVFMIEHDEDGALGVVITQPTRSKVVDVLPQLDGVVNPDDLIFVGGPVDHQAAIALAATPAGMLGDSEVIPGLGTVAIPGKDDPKDPVLDNVDAIRVFVGYSGWTGGQLEAELAADAWFTVRANPLDPVACDPATLWEQIVRAQRGETAWLALFPNDPRYN